MEQISAYFALLSNVLGSDVYLDANLDMRQKIEEWLASDKIKEYFNSKNVEFPENFYEAMILGIENSTAYREKTRQEQERISKYIRNSISLKNELGDLEKRLSEIDKAVSQKS